MLVFLCFSSRRHPQSVRMQCRYCKAQNERCSKTLSQKVVTKEKCNHVLIILLEGDTLPCRSLVDPKSALGRNVAISSLNALLGSTIN